MKRRYGKRDFGTPVPPTPPSPPPPSGGGGTPTQAGTRDAITWPFAQNSAWNMPIGGNAVFGPANLSRPNDGQNDPPYPGDDTALICMTPSATVRALNYSSAGWNNGANRCSGTGNITGFPRAVPIPDSWIVGNGAGNNSSGILSTDGVTLIQSQPFTRCNSGNDPTAFVVMPDVNIFSTGEGGSHGGSHLSGVGGVIRLGELRPGQIGMQHALACTLYAKEFLFKCTNNSNGYRWPATSQDGYAIGFYGTGGNATNAGNTNMVMGSLLAIPGSTNINALGMETQPGLQLAWTLQNYGVYIVDDSYSAQWLWCTEYSPSGSKQAEFQNDWGFSFTQRASANTAWMRDHDRLMSALRCVTNNSSSNVGGGGTPRQPLAPPFALYVSTTGSDTNPGTSASPFRTITKASSVATPGTTIFVANGSYNGSFTTSTSGSSAGGNITFKSINQWGAKLIPVSGSDTGWNVAGSYITVDGFEIDGQSLATWRNGMAVTGSHITVKNCNVHHIGKLSPCDSNGGAAIYTDGFSGQGDHNILACVIHNCGPGAPGACGTHNGIYMESQGWTVKDCLAYQCTGDGITSYHDSTNGFIINNTVFRCGRGIVCSGAGFYHLTAGGPFTIQNNIVYDNNPTGSNSTGGIGVANTLNSGSTVNNNLVVSNTGTAIGLASGVSSSGNITTGTPGFVSYVSDGSGDYHLAAGSQAIDAGLAANAPSTDLDGIARPQGNAIDIGCYEKV